MADIRKRDDEVTEEWKRFLESDEFLHNPECGSLLVARHFAEWQRERMMKGRVKINVNSDMDIVIKTNDMWEAAKAVGYKHGDVNLIVVPKED